MALIKNLTKERERWKESVSTFSAKRDKLVGESVLVAGFIVYAGLYDQKVENCCYVTGRINYRMRVFLMMKHLPLVIIWQVQRDSSLGQFRID